MISWFIKITLNTANYFLGVGIGAGFCPLRFPWCVRIARDFPRWKCHKIKPWELGVKSCILLLVGLKDFRIFHKKHAKKCMKFGGLVSWNHDFWICLARLWKFFFLCVWEDHVKGVGSLEIRLLDVLLKRNGAFVLTLMKIKQIQSCSYLNMKKSSFFLKVHVLAGD